MQMSMSSQERRAKIQNRPLTPYSFRRANTTPETSQEDAERQRELVAMRNDVRRFDANRELLQNVPERDRRPETPSRVRFDDELPRR